MSAIWLLSTKGRPDAAQATLDACEKTAMHSRGFVYVDGDSYPELRLPPNWRKIEVPEHKGLQGSMQWCFRRFPKASAYGWLADDNVPLYVDWAAAVEEAAGSWNLAYCRDEWISEINPGSLHNGTDLGGGVCWGGDLVRLVGWWATPGLFQGGIDLVWTRLLEDLGRTRYLENTIVLHNRWQSDRRAKDAIDDMPHVAIDVANAEEFLESEEFSRLRELISAVPA